MIACPSCQTEYDDDATRFCGRCGSDMRRAPPPTIEGGEDPLIGRVVDARYKIIGKLGQGGMGSVYKVEHQAMGKIAAMKVLHPALSADVEVGRRFRREAEAVSRLSHSNTVQVFDFGEQRGFMYLVMEYVKGEDLGSIIRRDGPLSFSRARNILMQVCDALSEAHDAGVVHRDLKPENLLVTRARDGHDVVKVLDFGLAKLRDSEDLSAVTARGSLVGTPFYMSPEQIRGEDLDARSDLYSLGAVMYRCVTGEHPFSGSTPVAVLTQHLTEDLDPPSKRRPDLDLDEAVDGIVMRAMAKEREKRYASADEMRAALEEAPHTSGQHARPPTPAAERRASDVREPSGVSPTGLAARREDFDQYERGLQRRRWMGVAIVPLVLLCAGAGGILYYTNSHRPTAREVEAEPNNSAPQANWLVKDHTVRGRIGARRSTEESDKDFYQLTVKKGTHVLYIELTGIPTMDLKLAIYNGAGTRLAEADSGGMGDGEIIPNLRVEAGDHYIEVREVWVSGRPATEDETNWYTLMADWHTLDASEEAEPDDSPSQAMPLPLDQALKGYLGRMGDVDYYYPRGEGGGTLSGTLSATEGVLARVVILPPGSTAGPPGTLPPGAKVFENKAPGEAIRFDGIAWPVGSPGPLVVIERKDKGRPVGLRAPYSLSVRLSR